MTKAGETGFVQHKRGHNQIVTGLAMMVFALPVFFAFIGSGMAGFACLVMLAGLITLLVGFGLRRETPTTE